MMMEGAEPFIVSSLPKNRVLKKERETKGKGERWTVFDLKFEARTMVTSNYLC